MISADLINELKQVGLIALERASVIHRRRVYTVEYKGSMANLVTDIDRDSEEILKNTIGAARPDDSIIGEEATSITGTSGICWYLDPLDGTTNFVHGYWGHAISVGVAVDSKPVLGLVLDTSRGNLYIGGQGVPATRDDQQIRVSSRSNLGECLVATGFLANGAVRRKQAQLLGDVLPLVRDVRRLGSPALDLCSVAFGAVDVYYEAGIGLIDVCAGAAIVEAAGGVVRRFAIDGLPDTVWVVGNQASTDNFIKSIRETQRWKVEEDHSWILTIGK
jgi:myo-inositol-1(or 4)-monophosphatase